MFQSTLPHGERLEHMEGGAFYPTFQSTLPHGERLAKRGNQWRCNRFQSTLPHGERPQLLQVRLPMPCFNPRSRMGSDSPTLNTRQNLPVSIHAPAWGATISIPFYFLYYMFQSTLPHGERHYFQGQDVGWHRFQSTLPHGERHHI